jgi:hypothetical protein
MPEDSNLRPELVKRAVVIPVSEARKIALYDLMETVERTCVGPLSDECKIVLYDLLETVDDAMVRAIARLASGSEQHAAALKLIAHLVYFSSTIVRVSESRDILPALPLPPR